MNTNNDTVELTLPAWCTALDEQRINEAIALAIALPPWPPSTYARAVVINEPSEAVALNGALIVLEAIAAVLIRAQERVPRDDRRLAAATLRDQVILWAYRDCRKVTPFNLPAAVETALDAAPWWQQLQMTLAEPSRP